jgi:hypothetical protein
MPDFVLNCDADDAHLLSWNLDYGVTHQRADALLAGPADPNSFRNPASETALTLFMLGNLDCWKQVGRLAVRPRQLVANRSSVWATNFFKSIRETRAVFRHHDGPAPLWTRIGLPIQSESLDFGNSVLLFEFEILNSAFHCVGDETFRDLSFLSLDGMRKWSQYDGFLLVPPKRDAGRSKGLLVGIEAKLSSDCSLRTAFYMHVNQIMRNLEAGFWLTNHPGSQYAGWEFHYVFICPQEALDYQTTFYSYVLNGIDCALANYKRLLERKLRRLVRDNALDRWPEFENAARDGRTLLTWRTISNVLTEQKVDFWQQYSERLAGFGPDFRQATIERLDAAGIDHGIGPQIGG